MTNTYKDSVFPFYMGFLFVCYFVFSFALYASQPYPKAEWIEDSFQIRFEYPRAWLKKVQRERNQIIVEFTKNQSIILRWEAEIIDKNIPLDRYIEKRLENYLTYYPDLSVVKELVMPENYKGFQESRVIFVRYKEKQAPVSSRYLFARHENSYYILHSKVLTHKFSEYKKDIDVFFHSFEKVDPPEGRWRNDSLDYIQNESIILEVENQKNPQRDLNITTVSPQPTRQNPSKMQSERYINEAEPGTNPNKKEILPVEE